MKRSIPMILFKALFATLVLSVFGAFSVYWNDMFGENGSLPARAEASVAPAPCCDNGAPAEEPEAPTRDERTRAAMFKTRIDGPYALSVRDGLNEMMIVPHLLEEGVQGTSAADASLEAVLTAIPSMLPTHGYMSSGFGTRRSPFTRRLMHHNGVDFAVPWGAPVYATADGVVTFAGRHQALGRLIAIDHGYGITTRYGHNAKLLVQPGDKVHRGDVIANAGSTGRSTGPHVHYEVWINGKVIDPAGFMFEVPEVNFADTNHPGLGLAMGGDGEPPVTTGKAWASVPSADERLPVNLAIIGSFAVAMVMIASVQIPTSDRTG